MASSSDSAYSRAGIRVLAQRMLGYQVAHPDRSSHLMLGGQTIFAHMHLLATGGQAKRVSIGLALVTDVHVLGLDEPTSGLDSYTATEVRSSD